MALIPVGDTEKQDSRPVDTWQRRLYDDLHVSLYLISIPVSPGTSTLFNFVSYSIWWWSFSILLSTSLLYHLFNSNHQT